MRLIPRTLVLAASFATLGACTTGPLNGTPYAGANTVGASFTFQGYSNQANQLISLQVLTSPTADPSKDASWAQFTTTHTSSNPIVVAGDTANPLYSWQTTAVPASNGFAGWPVGGVLRTRAISYDNNTNATRQLVTFDAPTFSQCFGAAWAAGETWTQIGQNCAGLGNSMVSLVSSAKNPLTLPRGPAAGLARLQGRHDAAGDRDVLRLVERAQDAHRVQDHVRVHA